MTEFLPVHQTDMQKRGWDSLDFLLISADAYVDHPSFGHAILGRLLEDAGYRVGLIAQPDWTGIEDFKRMGTPSLGVLVIPGVLDSMVSNYTASRIPRKKDSYSPGGEKGHRPDRAAIVYSNRAREAFPDTPVILGGMEASLRRFAHYDFWQDKVRASVLADCGADLLVYGEGENTILEIASLLQKGVPVHKMKGIRGTCYLVAEEDNLPNEVQQALQGQNTDKVLALPSYEEVAASKKLFAQAFLLQYREQDPFWGRTILQPHGKRLLVQNPPRTPMTTEEMDRVYALPFTGTWHPSYQKKGGVPALEEVKFSITSHRGCFGSCSFCSITFHQGRIIRSRSKGSIVNEVEAMAANPDFKGYIHDIGGPTANFRRPACKKQGTHGSCRDRECLFPEPCKNLQADHGEYLDILRAAQNVPGVKKVFIRSGIRFDYLLQDTKSPFFSELCKNHISGQMKVAPEHVSPQVLRLMRKSGPEVYEKFRLKYEAFNQENNLKQYLVPYFISGHPGSTLQDAVKLAIYMKKTGFVPDQVQQFYPTPGTMSTCMYYTGIHPETGEEIHVPKSKKEMAMQRALLQFYKPQNHALVKEALRLTGNDNLIGFLLSPRADQSVSSSGDKGKGRKSKPTREKRERSNRNQSAKSQKTNDRNGYAQRATMHKESGSAGSRERIKRVSKPSGSQERINPRSSRTTGPIERAVNDNRTPGPRKSTRWEDSPARYQNKKRPFPDEERARTPKNRSVARRRPSKPK